MSRTAVQEKGLSGEALVLVDVIKDFEHEDGELLLESHFEQATQLVSEDDIAETVVCGPDPGAHRAMIEKHAEAGYDHVCIHQVGLDQEGFLDFSSREILS